MANKKIFEISRHAHKEGKNVSRYGEETAKEKAREIFRDIEKLPAGAIVCFIPSNIWRARQTKNILEEKVEELMRNSPDKYVIANLGEEDVLAIAEKNPNKNILLKTSFYDSGIGFEVKKDSAIEDPFDKYRESLGEDEELIGKLWITQRDEMPELRQEIGEKGLDASQELNPADFIETPEEVAIKQLEWVKRIKEVADQFAPNRTVKMFGISHNMQTDVMDMALLGMPINLASLRKLGGKFRDSLESSVLTFRDDEIISEFRGRSNVIVGQSLDIIIEDLRAKSIKRKEEWLE